jgi:hypothetical protein
MSLLDLLMIQKAETEERLRSGRSEGRDMDELYLAEIDRLIGAAE